MQQKREVQSAIKDNTKRCSMCKEYKPFSDVKEIVQERLLQEKTETLFRDWIYNLKSTSYIEIKI